MSISNLQERAQPDTQATRIDRSAFNVTVDNISSVVEDVALIIISDVVLHSIIHT